MRRLLTVLALFALAPLTSGCLTAVVANNTFGAIDQAVSQKLDKDCSTYYLVGGKSYCQDRLHADLRAPVYCTRTLGGVECYSETDPYAVTDSARVAAPRVLTSPPRPESR